MPLNFERTRRLLQGFDFKTLFIDELGWDHYTAALDISIDGQNFRLGAISEKRGMVVFICEPLSDGAIPGYPIRRKIERQIAKSHHEHLIVFPDVDKSRQIWQWVKREAGKPAACREHTYYVTQPGDSLIQKISTLAFSLEEEEGLGIVEVGRRAKKAFDVEKITKRFYDRFKAEHGNFLKFLKGIPDEKMQRWYVSVMLNRLMFIYFIQKKGFLDRDVNYLRSKLEQSKERGKNRYYKSFLCPLFFEGFGKKENERLSETNELLGEVPYLNGGLFQRHQIEVLHGKEIKIEDAAFEDLFAFFDQYHWHLDERSLRADNEINPDVLGYIFEKYINQKQMGAYYTKEDITEYISKNTIIPFLFDKALKKHKAAFEGDQSVWRLLRDEPDRYIYDAVKKGATLPLPEEIAAEIKDVSKRTQWNKPAPEEYALPTEIWREVVARRKRYEEVRAKMSNGEIESINDLITYNLDIRQFAQDAIENCETSELLRAFWHAIEDVTVLDPTCGSGAFLFAALNILEPLYEACLERMEAFLDELEQSGEKHRPEKFSDFRKLHEKVAVHRNPRYFILKSIMVNNLYGVDIMEEATEICKLRVFLKLVAQVERVEAIEPLPDIDFNIRAGNTLVGFASYNEVKNAVEGELQGRFDFDNTMGRIEEKAQDVDRLFNIFREMQTKHGMDAKDFADAKQELISRLKKLEDELNRYLASEYGVRRDSISSEKKYNKEFAKWRDSHQPFHWFIEFYGIMKKGGFDVIIGNPPYLTLNALKNYSVRNFVTSKSRNLYALIIERCQFLTSRHGWQGYIVPVSSIATEGYSSLQDILISRKLFISSYDDRPAHLFTGLDKNTLSILLLSESIESTEAHSTRLCRWSVEERDTLLSLLAYENVPDTKLNGCIPKIGCIVEVNIWNKIFERCRPLLTFCSRDFGEVMYYSRKINAFLQVLDFVPEVRDGNGNLRPPSEFKELRFSSAGEAAAAVCCFNSSLFRWFMDVVSDGSHINRREVDNFPFNPGQANAEFPALITLAGQLAKSLQVNSEHRVMRYKHDTLRVQCIIPKHSKPTIDEIDRILARYYGFTEEELDFIINYDIKYRMGLV